MISGTGTDTGPGLDTDTMIPDTNIGFHGGARCTLLT